MTDIPETSTPASGDTPPVPEAQVTPAPDTPRAEMPASDAPSEAPPASGASPDRSGAYLINLSSGEVTPEDLKKPAPPPPPIPASGESRGHGGVFTVNLASAETEGSRPRRTRKVAAAPALITKTINLSTPKEERKAAEPERAKEATAQAKASGGSQNRGGGRSQSKGPRGGGAPGAKKGRRGDARGNDATGGGRASSGSSLAELLDPEVLKKLRGG